MINLFVNKIDFHITCYQKEIKLFHEIHTLYKHPSQQALLHNVVNDASKDKVNDDVDNERNKILHIVAQRNDLDLALELLVLRCETTAMNKANKFSSLRNSSVFMGLKTRATSHDGFEKQDW